MRILRRLVAVTFLLVATLTFAPSLVHAVDPMESITLSPTSKIYKVDAGQTLDDTIAVLNDGQTAYDFIVYTAPYSVENNTYKPDFTSTKANSDAYEWVQFAKTVWHIEPRQTIRVPYKIRVKDNASPGGHYGVIFAETQPQADSASLARKKRVGTILYATVNGDVRLSGETTGTSIPWFVTRPPIGATLSVKNTGNSDFMTRVSYQVSDVFGSVKYTAQSDYAVLPSTTRDIAVGWADAPWFGLYKVQASVKVLDNVTLAESYVLIMPTWLLLLFGVMVVSGGIYAIRRLSRSQTQS